MEARTGPLLLDAPTLFEAGLDGACRRILAVTAPEAARLARVMARDGLGEAEARLRFRAQPGEDFYTSRADWVVENGTGEKKKKRCAALAAELKSGGCL